MLLYKQIRSAVQSDQARPQQVLNLRTCTSCAVVAARRVADRHKLYTEWHEQFGPFVRVRVAHRNMLLVADPAAASSILVKGPGYVPKKPSEYTAFDVVRANRNNTAFNYTSALCRCWSMSSEGARPCA
jgi:hypothetical protein